VHHSAELSASATLIGPVLIGASARIAAGAIVIGPATLGPRSCISEGAVVTRSVIWDSCIIGSRAIVDAAVVVSGASIDAGRNVYGHVALPTARGLITMSASDVSPLWHLPELPFDTLRTEASTPSPADAAVGSVGRLLRA
jgi:NDP-sugar pyrophosphorylase family protein